MALRITCIVPDSSDPEARIEGVGGVGWTLSEDMIIGEIEDGANYFVEIDYERVPAVVAERDGRKYLTSDPDKTTENKLLSLPPAPVMDCGDIEPIRVPTATAYERCAERLLEPIAAACDPVSDFVERV